MLNSIFNENEIKRLIREAIREEVASQIKEMIGMNPNNAIRVEQSKQDNNVIKGVKGLAKFLGCGVNSAQNIINSEILLNKKIQYRTGKGWRFRKDKLTELLEKEPEILKKSTQKVGLRLRFLGEFLGDSKNKNDVSC